MDRSIIDSLERVLASSSSSSSSGSEDIRSSLWACLDHAPPGDEDAIDLRFVLEKLDLPAALEEFRRLLAEIRARGRDR